MVQLMFINALTKAGVVLSTGQAQRMVLCADEEGASLWPSARCNTD
jgi:hypothetical protein